MSATEQGYTEDPEIFRRKFGEWQQIRKLVKRRNFTIDTIKSYFQAHGLRIPPGVLEKEGSSKDLTETPPKMITLDMLIEFKDYLTGSLG